MKHLIRPARCVYLPLLTIALLGAGPARAQRPRSAYAPAARPSLARRTEVDKLVQPHHTADEEASARRPSTVSLLEKLATSRSELQRHLQDGASLSAASADPAAPLRQIHSLLETSQDQRQQHLQRMNVMLERLEAMIIVPPTGPPGAVTQQINAGSSDDSAPRNDQPSPPEVPTPVDATGRAVDRLRLADSLFGSDKFVLARDIYLELRESSSHAGERVWIEFQIASSYRNLSDLANAQKFYRLVVGSKEEPLAGYARWWLVAIQEQQDLNKTLDQINHSITQTGQQNHGTN